MSEDNFLIPPSYERHSDRYRVRPTNRVWTPQEVAVTAIVLASCDSPRQYSISCTTLCSIMNREPVFPPGSRPTSDQILKESIALIEVKILTKMLDRWPTNFDPQRLGTKDLRTGLPITWAEEERFFRPYLAKRQGKGTGTTLGIDRLAILIGRGQTDHRMIKDHLEWMGEGGKKLWRRINGPFDDIRGPETEQCVARYLRIKPNDAGSMHKAMRELIGHLVGPQEHK